MNLRSWTNDRWAWALILVGVLIVAALSYQQYSYAEAAIAQGNHVTYTMVGAKEHSGGRGRYYTMNADLHGVVYEVDISSEMYDDVLAGELPALYYSAPQNELYSQWTATMHKRLLWLLMIVFVIGSIIFVKTIPKQKHKKRKK